MIINPIITELLNKRGICSEEDIEEFLSEKPQKTYDPFLLLNMEAGVDLIMSAIKANKHICIYGDYDADGITATSLMMQVLSEATDNLSYYIPSRFDEGYGLNKDAIKTIKDDGAGMILTVDCGSVSADEVEYAKELGLDILITDHHTITDTVADCLLINPKQKNCPYPFKELAGVGVAFKLAKALETKGVVSHEVLGKVLDLVAIGTIGDIVPLLDENRTLAKYGLRALNISNRIGLNALIRGVSLHKGSIKSEEIAFGIVPHLNAAGRMEDASFAVKLMCTGDEAKAAAGVSKLVSCNSERKRVQEETYKACMKQIEAEAKQDYEARAEARQDYEAKAHAEKEKQSCYVIYAGDAHEGITGIVAGKIKDYYNRPAIVVTPSGEYYKGTGRSIEGINLYDLLKKYEDYFIKFGGHSAACGFLMKKENFGDLKEGLNRDVAEILAQNPILACKDFSGEIKTSISRVSLDLLEQIERLAPFGCKNKRPTFIFENVFVEDLRLMGDDGSHAGFVIRDNEGSSLRCVLFRRAAEYNEVLRAGKAVSVTGIVECREWKGNRNLQLIVEGII